MYTRKAYSIIQTRTHNYDLYILEQPSSWSTLRIRPSWPQSRLRLSLLLASLSEHACCCHVQPSILLFISMDQVSHLTSSLLSGWLLTKMFHSHGIACSSHQVSSHFFLCWGPHPKHFSQLLWLFQRVTQNDCFFEVEFSFLDDVLHVLLNGQDCFFVLSPLHWC